MPDHQYDLCIKKCTQKSYSTSGRCPYFVCWETEIKNRAKKVVKNQFLALFLSPLSNNEIWTSTTRWIALREYNRLATKNKRKSSESFQYTDYIDDQALRANPFVSIHKLV
jgi:hypothetical protein